MLPETELDKSRKNGIESWKTEQHCGERERYVEDKLEPCVKSAVRRRGEKWQTEIELDKDHTLKVMQVQ